jgi:hypothetical protein
VERLARALEAERVRASNLAACLEAERADMAEPYKKHMNLLRSLRKEAAHATAGESLASATPGPNPGDVEKYRGVCEHGSFRRSCPVCELREERDEWKQRFVDLVINNARLILQGKGPEVK